MSVCYKMKEKESYIEKQKGIFGDTTWFTYRYEVNGMVYELRQVRWIYVERHVING